MDIMDLKDDDVILVDRLYLFDRLAETGDKFDPKLQYIIEIAIDEMNRGVNISEIPFGPALRVKDIKKIFPDYEQKPSYYFRAVN